jgi:hypothetical protein
LSRSPKILLGPHNTTNDQGAIFVGLEVKVRSLMNDVIFPQMQQEKADVARASWTKVLGLQS